MKPFTAAVACLCLCVTALGAPAVPGCRTSLYSTVPANYRPYTAAWDAAGRLYLGSDNNDLAGEFLRRIPADGGPSEIFTSTRIYDADGILVDTSGFITGTPGTILVASGTTDGGRISAVDAFGTVSTFTLQGAELNNCDSMAVDALGNVLINVPGNRSIARRTGGVFSTYINLPGVAGGVLAMDAGNALWIGCGDGQLRRYNVSGPTGTLELTVPIGGTDVGLGYCPAGLFGSSIYAVDRSAGNLYRVAGNGTSTLFGTGFPSGAYSLAFNERGEMLVPDWNTGEIWRLSCGADFDSDGFLTFEDFDTFVAAFETGNSDADFNKDGFLTFEDFDGFVGLFEAGC